MMTEKQIQKPSNSNFSYISENNKCPVIKIINYEH